MLQGYKIMLLTDNRLYSLADRRLSIPLVRGFRWSAPGGIWLGTTIEHVQSYYGSPDPEDPEEMNLGEYEARCIFGYQSIIRGTTSFQGTRDPGVEFAVPQVILLEVYNVTLKFQMELKHAL